MKPLPFKIPPGSKESITVYHDKLPHFYATYHNHEELQLMLVIKGHGTAYIGDKIVQFKEGDVYLLGQNLPHVFKDKMDPKRNNGIESISIFFLPGFMGDGFLAIPETRLLSTLIKESERGVFVEGDLRERVTAGIWQVTRQSGLPRLLTLIELLEQIAQTEELTFISSPGYHKPKRTVDGRKINDVFNFLLDNYAREIKLEEIADVAHMSPTAFCRYFKQHTRKTYSRFLNEIRIGQACKMLVDDQYTVGDICYNSGFNNVSNFNRQFKKVTGLTPSEYQKMHR